MHQINNIKKQQLLPSDLPPPLHFKQASPSSMIKIIVILAFVVIIFLYIITNIFFSYELHSHHKASIERIQERLKNSNDHHHFVESVEKDADGKEKHHVEEIHGLHENNNNNNVAAAAVTTRTPSAKFSGMIFNRTIAIPFPKWEFAENERKRHREQHDKQGNQLSQNEFLKLGFRDVGVQDISLQLRNVHNFHQFSEHYVRAARGFFPPHVAKKWRQELMHTWRMSERMRKHQKLEEGDEDHWLFTTNNDGTAFGQKVASKEKIEARKNFALIAYNHNHDTFAYTKWELQRKHPLHLEISNYMKSKETKTALCRMLAEDCPDGFVEKATLGDFFLSLFESDDFLSPHSDGALGSITTASHFLVDTTKLLSGEVEYQGFAEEEVEEAEEGSTDSGAVEFFCQDKQAWCVRLKVNKNELVVFKTQPDNALHRVNQMLDKKYLRFGVTGFYAMPGEVQVLEY